MHNDEFQKLVLEKLSANDDFQKLVLAKLSANDDFQKLVLAKLSANDDFQKLVLAKLSANDDFHKLFLEKLSAMEIRQNETYQVVRAIEHSNNVGKAEVDDHNIRLAKSEGTLKKIARVIDEEFDKASSL